MRLIKKIHPAFRLISLIILISFPVGCSDSGDKWTSHETPSYERLLEYIYQNFSDYYVYPDAVRIPQENETPIEYINSYQSENDLYTQYHSAVEMNYILDSIDSDETLIVRTYSPSTLYIAFDSFTNGTARRVADTIESHINEGYDQLILDLRLNSGGYPDEAVALLDYFTDQPAGTDLYLSEGAYETIQYQKNDVDYLLGSNETEYVFNSSSMYVLTSGLTASAAEILVGGLIHFDEATQAGSTTFGKNRSYYLFSLSDTTGDGYSMTNAVIYHAGDMHRLFDREGIGHTPETGNMSITPFDRAAGVFGIAGSDPLTDDWDISYTALNNLYSQDFWRGQYTVATLIRFGKFSKLLE